MAHRSGHEAGHVRSAGEREESLLWLHSREGSTAAAAVVVHH